MPSHLREAVAHGEPHALYELGNMFTSGPPDIEKDVKKGLALWRRAADKGYLEAMLALGQASDAGRLTAKDDRQAAAWYRRVLAQPAAGPTALRLKASARYSLGQMLIEGRGMPRDAPAGLALLELAAESGDSGIQWVLGQHYAEGRVTPRDDARALQWFRIAADRNDGRSQFAVGRAYAEGRGVAQDKAEAARWYLNSALNDTYEARLPLALAYHRGEGVPRDDLTAHLWASKAAETSMLRPDVQALLETLEKNMTPREAAEARERARAYRPRPL